MTGSEGLLCDNERIPTENYDRCFYGAARNLAGIAAVNRPLYSFAMLAALLWIPAPASGGSVTLVDEQVNTIDYAIDGWLSVYNQSATFIVDGGDIQYSTLMYQLSWLEMSGGSIGYDLTAYTQSEVYLFGGNVGRTLQSSGSASIDWSGGSVGGDVVADGNSVVRIYGTDFTVDSVPVPYGVLTAAEGTLRGHLNDGTMIGVPFHHAGALWNGAAVTGTIELVDGIPVQSPAPDFSDWVVLLNDGGVHSVDDDRFDVPLGVRLRSPGVQTTLNVLPGAEIGQYISASGNSRLNISGGDIGFRADSSTVLGISDQVEFTMTGGVIHGWSYIDQQATAEISGGTLTGETWLGLEAQLRLSGGFLDGRLAAWVDSHLEMEGGFLSDDLEVEGTAILRGGELFGDLIADPGGEVQIIGSNFELWGNPVGFGDLVPLSGMLTGTLESGDPVSVYFERRQFVVSETETLEGRIQLIPEPAQAPMLAAGIGCLIALSRRRKTGAKLHANCDWSARTGASERRGCAQHTPKHRHSA